MLAAIDARSLEDGTTRSEAIRRLLELGLRTQTADQINEAKSHAAQAAKLASELGLKAKGK
jgi:negative regulator of replication initiation